MLKFSISLQTAVISLAVSCPLLLVAALGSATRFLSDVGCFLFEESSLNFTA
ncbi:hypothetical protein QUA74_19715 [Microcoleus sp. LAD1_D3]|uniref:hypothetical protein n=1 Tax=Microcoleus sp. LAD1_D3 TaxID=2819365 RepID=UPI002FCF27BE